MKPVSTVQLPIAKFRDIIRDFDRDNDGLAEWVRSFSKALICDKNLNDFASELLEEVESYKAKNTARVAEFREKRKSQSSHEEERLDEDPTVARTVGCKKRQSGDTTKAPTYSALPSHSIPSLDDFAAELLNDVNEYRKEDARKKREKRKSLPQPSSYEEERLDEDPTVARTVGCKKRQSGDTTKAPPTYSALPSHSIPSLEEVYDYARSQELDDILTREWFEMTSERQWCDRNGEVIKSWKIALKSYVRRRISNIIKEETKL